MLVRLGGFTGYFDFSEYLKRRQKGKRGEESRKALKKFLSGWYYTRSQSTNERASHPPQQSKRKQAQQGKAASIVYPRVSY